MNKVAKANRYSDAIFDIALQDNSTLNWVNFLEELSKLMSDLSVASFFQDPKIRTELKKDLILLFPHIEKKTWIIKKI